MKKAAFMMTVLLVLGVVVCAQTIPKPGPGGGLYFDVLPRTMQGRVMVPLRAIFEWVGARVEYQAGQISAYDAGSQTPRVVLWIGQTQAQLSGQPYQLDVPPVVIEGRTFVPLRFVAESFGVWVDAKGRTVTLQMPQYNLKADMAIPPAEGSHESKIWGIIADWYGAEAGQPTPGVIGIRVVADQADPHAGVASVKVLAKWDDGSYTQDEFSLHLERTGWQIDGRSSAAIH